MSVKAHVQTITKSNQTPQILAALKRAGKSYVTVGVHEGSGQYGKGGTNAATPAKVALWLEWGTSRMPRRPFMAPTMARQKGAIAAVAARSLAALAYTKITVGQGLGAIGAAVVTMIQNTIKSNVGPALSGSWDPAKGYLGWRRKHYEEAGQRTLIASGLLLRSVRFKLHLDGHAAAEQAEAQPLYQDGAPQAGQKKGAQAGRDEHGRFIKNPQQAAAAANARAHARTGAEIFKANQRTQRQAANKDPAKAAAAFASQRRAYTRAQKPSPGDKK